MIRIKHYTRCFLEALGIAILFGSPWICYFLEMKQ